jgi:TolB-like protein/Flp pilus assembly protein TadD/class 3 adenylate cyclase
MPADATTDPEFEIGHVLFIDIVGYSKLLIGEQSELVRQLKEVVAGSDQVRLAERQDKLVSLPTGDGVALVFRNGSEAPAQCAVEIARAVDSYPELHLRMGIHSGPVNVVTDVNNRANMTGAGINIAQRVMNCGDAGHILLSKHGAEDLEAYARWRPYLHDLGECEVKHGARISLVNLCGDNFGNAEIPEKLKGVKREQARISRARRERTLLLTAILAVAAFGIGFWIFRQNRATDLTAIPEKSVAVLPFENRSTEKENAFFADGVQDEILTDLSKIADLKVISRTSVMHYKVGTARDARAIAQALGVAYLLEGSVQRAAGKIRVNAQLIDARNDSHRWAQTYDRDLADVFAIQSEIAKTIADQLEAKLSPGEQAEIERRPTSNDAAFALYTQARTLLVAASSSDPDKATFLHAVDFLNQAVSHDPNFFRAYCDLVHAHAELYFYNFDHSLERRTMAENALQNAVRLRPDAAETHLAQAEYLYRCYLKNDEALAELQLAARALPNNSRVYELSGYIERRRGRWEEARRDLEKAQQLDPRNLVILQQIANFYPYLRQFDEEAAAIDRLLKLMPNDQGVRVSRAFVEVERRANLEPYREAVRSILESNPENKEDIASEWFAVAWYGRDANQATQAATSMPPTGTGSNAVRFPRAWYQGLAAQLSQNSDAAREAFSRARTEIEHEVQQRPAYGPPVCVLAMINAMLGQKEDAIRQGQRAVELLPIDQDAINGSHLIMNLAIIYAATGEKSSAIDELETLFKNPGDGSYGDLKLNPFWDPLRGEPRFEKLVVSLAPKD